MSGTILWFGPDAQFADPLRALMRCYGAAIAIRPSTMPLAAVSDAVAGVLVSGLPVARDCVSALGELLGPPWYCASLVVVTEAEIDTDLAVQLHRCGVHNVVCSSWSDPTHLLAHALLNTMAATFTLRATLALAPPIMRLRSPTVGLRDRGSPPVRARAIAAGLTQRETEVYVLHMRGLQQKEIADELRISPNTVKRHSSMARRKLGVQTMKAALAEFIDGAGTDAG